MLRCRQRSEFPSTISVDTLYLKAPGLGTQSADREAVLTKKVIYEQTSTALKKDNPRKGDTVGEAPTTSVPVAEPAYQDRPG